MTEAWDRVRLGDVLRRSDFTIALDPDVTYKEVTVRINGKGVVERRQVLGREIASSRRYPVKDGQFIISRIDARNGASGLIPSELDGAVVTNDFPVFDIRQESLHPPFLSWLCKTETFVDLCKRASEGTTNRVRLSEERFNALQVSLPSVDVQKRIVARIDELAIKIAEARALRTTAVAELDAYWPSTLRLAFEGKLVKPVPFKKRAISLLEDSAKAHARYSPSNNNNAYPNEPRTYDTGPHVIQDAWCWTTLGSVLTHIVDCVNDTPNFSDTDTGLLGLKTTNVRPYQLDLQRRWYVTPEDFALWNRREAPRAGDIIFTREAPLGNVCMMPDNVSACLTQRLMLLRAENRVINPRYLLHFLNSPCFTQQLSASGRGQTHHHLRVGDAPDFLVPLAPLEQQQCIVDFLDSLLKKMNEVRDHQSQTEAELQAMLSSVLEKAFKGELI
jgi:type I restriction enzyme S subunit